MSTPRTWPSSSVWSFRRVPGAPGRGGLEPLERVARRLVGVVRAVRGSVVRRCVLVRVEGDDGSSGAGGGPIVNSRPLHATWAWWLAAAPFGVYGSPGLVYVAFQLNGDTGLIRRLCHKIHNVELAGPARVCE